jgi:hypothetical protein
MELQTILICANANVGFYTHVFSSPTENYHF